jgi:hypothetical protein
MTHVDVQLVRSLWFRFLDPKIASFSRSFFNGFSHSFHSRSRKTLLLL